MAVFKPEKASFFFPIILFVPPKYDPLLYIYALFMHGLLQQPYRYSLLSFIPH